MKQKTISDVVATLKPGDRVRVKKMTDVRRSCTGKVFSTEYKAHEAYFVGLSKYFDVQVSDNPDLSRPWSINYIKLGVFEKL